MRVISTIALLSAMTMSSVAFAQSPVDLTTGAAANAGHLQLASDYRRVHRHRHVAVWSRDREFEGNQVGGAYQAGPPPGPNSWGLHPYSSDGDSIPGFAQGS